MDHVAMKDLAARVTALERSTPKHRRGTIASLNPTVVTLAGGEQVQVSGDSPPKEPGVVGNVVDLFVFGNDVVIIPRDYHGQYTPTISALVNTTVSIVDPWSWSRNGNRVTVFGRFTADPTTASIATSFKASLPQWGIGVAGDLAGCATCVSGATAGQLAEVGGDAGNDLATFELYVPSASSLSWSTMFGFSIG